jgi:SAM-dependent methyltransferase
MLLYALSGFCALSLEILWFRLMDVALKSIAFTFGTVLCLYLLGNAAGTFLGIALVPRLRRPLAAFLLCQCALLTWSGLAVALLVWLSPDLPGLHWLFEYWGGIGVLRLRAFSSAFGDVARLYIALPLFLFGLPTVLMGLSFPILQRAVHDDAIASGRKVGLLQASNITGCLLGSLLVGLLLLEVLGTAGTLRALMVVGLVFAAAGLREGTRRSAFAGLAVGFACLLAFIPSQRALWLRLHGVRDPRGAFALEDATGVAAITRWPGPSGRSLWRVWVSGKSNSVLPFGGVHTALGAAPALIHPAPCHVAIIGLGSGDTAWAAGCRRDATETVTVYEIIGPQKRLLEALAREPEPPPKLHRVLEDPRFRHLVADGRNAIDLGEARFDLIEMDALFPGSAGSGNLYSLDFFERCARKLRPGGLVCAWSPTPRVFATFKAAFPHVLELHGRDVLVGSLEPIPLDLDAWQARTFAPDVQGYLGEGRAQEVWRDYLRTAQSAGAAEVGDLNRDLFPRDEFNTR